MADAASIKANIRAAFRSHNIEGVPASGEYEPDKALIRATVGDQLVDYVSEVAASAVAGRRVFATTTERDAWTDRPVGAVAYVEPPTDQTYRWDGDSWEAFEDPTFQAAADALTQAGIATNAAAEAEAAADLISGVISPDPAPDYLLAFGDTTRDGHVALGIVDDERASIVNPHFQEVEAKAEAGAEVAQRVEPLDSAYLFALGDQTPDGNAIFAVDGAGRVINPHINQIDTDVQRLNEGAGAGWLRLRALFDLLHIIIYGQSLSVGAAGTPVVSNTPLAWAKSFNVGVRTHITPLDYAAQHAAMIDLVETSDGARGETIASGAALMIRQLLLDEDGIDLAEGDQEMLFSAPGFGGQTVTALAPGGEYFATLQSDLSQGAARAAEADKAYAAACLCWLQGEANMTTDPDYWAAQVETIRAWAQAHAQTVSGLSRSLPVIQYQSVTWEYYGAPAPTLPIKMWEMARDHDLYALATPIYHLPYADEAHLTAAGYRWLGAYFGLAIKRWFWDGRKPRHLSPEPFVRQGKVIILPFANVVGSLVIDTTTITDPGDAGLSVTGPGGEGLAIASVSVVTPTSIKIVLDDTVPAGATVWGGWNGTTTPGPVTGSRICIRDSRGANIAFTPPEGGADLPLHAWCPLFEIGED